MSYVLSSGDVFTPLLLEDKHGVSHANDWASGFMRGMELRREDWAPLVEDEDHGGSLVPIFALAHEHDPDPGMRPYNRPISAEQREKLIVGTDGQTIAARPAKAPSETPYSFPPRRGGLEGAVGG